MKNLQLLNILFFGFFALLGAALLQTLFLFSLGVSFELVSAVLIALAFFVDIGAYAVFLLFTFWIMRLSPFIGGELVLLIALLLVVYGLKRFFPGHPWLAAGIAGAATTAVFYIFILGGAIFSIWSQLFLIVFGTGFISAVVAGILGMYYPVKRAL